ncbi:MAG: FAD-dependent oxidoreductase [Actinobacteria bacterium]|nr:FAD-dependent oxidoreductase [Actinomycetota bacterium]
MQPDVAVIGGGAAGLGAAMWARRGGADVVLIERDRLGGDCTWTGCVPSKTVIEYARRAHHARELGLGDGRVDSADVLARVHKVVHEIAGEEDADALGKLGITVLDGQARFLAPDVLDVDGTTVRPGSTIVATGSTAAIPPIDGLRDVSPLTNEHIFSLERLPDRLAVLGAGAIGLELGQAFARLGTEVTLLDLAPRVAVGEEPETSATLTKVLDREGVDIRTGVTVDRVDRSRGGVTLHAGDVELVTADDVLVAVGRRPVTDGLDLHRAGIELADDGTIPVDRRMRTAVTGILAAGDVTSFPRLTHAGYRMGQIAAHTARSRIPWRFAPDVLPWAIFTDPEVGRVGMTEAIAYERWGSDARVASFPMRKTDRGRVAGETDGFVKLVAAPHPVARTMLGGRLVGATVVCPTGGDVVGELALAVRTRTSVTRLGQTVHAYPTWSFGVWQAIGRFMGPIAGASARPARDA